MTKAMTVCPVANDVYFAITVGVHWQIALLTNHIESYYGLQLLTFGIDSDDCPNLFKFRKNLWVEILRVHNFSNVISFFSDALWTKFHESIGRLKQYEKRASITKKTRYTHSHCHRVEYSQGSVIIDRKYFIIIYIYIYIYIYRMNSSQTRIFILFFEHTFYNGNLSYHLCIKNGTFIFLKKIHGETEMFVQKLKKYVLR